MVLWGFIPFCLVLPIGGSPKSLIDHIIVRKDVNLGQISGDDAAIVRLEKSVQSFSSTVSDHIPIVMRVVSRQAPLDSDGISLGPDTKQIEIPDGAKSVLVNF